MKAFFVPAGLLAVILGCSLWAGRYVETRTDAWTAQLEEAAAAAGREDWGQVRDALEGAYADWARDKTFFHTIIEHDELDEMEQNFRAVTSACEQQDGGELLFQLDQLTGQLERIAETQGASIQNFF